MAAKDKAEKRMGKLVTTEEAAAYLGLEYTLFRRARNLGYIGADKYPTPRFINIGVGAKGIRYRLTDLDEWLANYPTHATPALFFKEVDYKGRKKNEAREAAAEYDYGR